MSLLLVIALGVGSTIAPSQPSARTANVVLEEYAHWFDRTTHDVERLLLARPLDVGTEDASSGTVDPEWKRLQTDLEMVFPPIGMQTAHDLLQAAIRLGRVATGDRLDRRAAARDRDAALAGAALLVIRARELVEAGLAESPDNDP